MFLLQGLVSTCSENCFHFGVNIEQVEVLTLPFAMYFEKVFWSRKMLDQEMRERETVLCAGSLPKCSLDLDGPG